MNIPIHLLEPMIIPIQYTYMRIPIKKNYLINL